MINTYEVCLVYESSVVSHVNMHIMHSLRKKPLYLCPSKIIFEGPQDPKGKTS